MRIPLLLLALAFLPLAGCDRKQKEMEQSAKSERDPQPATAPKTSGNSAVQILKQLATLPSEEQQATLEEHIYQVPDQELDLVIESILAHQDPALKRTLLTSLFEETDLRPTAIRLPLLLEIARQPEVEPSLRATLMAELGAQLDTEHGTSWADWAIAIEAHLAETEGLIRVK